MSVNLLFVLALEAEARDQFDDVNVLFTGVGKVNASISLTNLLGHRTPGCIINVGTAGSQKFKPGTIVNATRFIQRDMDVRPLGFAHYQTPFSKDEIILHYGGRAENFPDVICGTGDNFEARKTGQEPWDIVDMEAYALALICKRKRVPFLCLKYISDGADGAAKADWDKALDITAQALKGAVNTLRFI